MSAALRETGLSFDGLVPSANDSLAERADERFGCVDEADLVSFMEAEAADCSGRRVLLLH